MFRYVARALLGRLRQADHRRDDYADGDIALLQRPAADIYSLVEILRYRLLFYLVRRRISTSVFEQLATD